MKTEDGDELTSTLTGLAPREHLCLVYENREEQLDAVIPFLHEGLEKGEKCLYVADENTLDEIRYEMKKSGIRVDLYMESGALALVTSRESYVPDGRFDPDAMILFLEEAVKEAKRSGYPALRVSGEMTWVLAGDPGSERFIEYESKLCGFFAENDCLAICQYNRKKFSPDTILDLAHMHPKVIYGRNVWRNPSPIRPSDYGETGKSSRQVREALNSFGRLEELADRLNERERIEKTRYRELFNNLGSAVAVYEAVGEGEDFIFKDFNRAGERMECIRKEDLLGRSVLEVFPGVKDFGLLDVFRRVWRTGRPERHPVSLYKDNRIAGWRENYVYRLPSGEIVAIYDDVTSIKQAEESLRESQRKLSTLISNLQGMVYSCQNDKEWTMQFVSRGSLELTGHEPEELIGNKVRSYGQIIHPEDRDRVWEIIQETLKRQSVYTMEYRIVARNGKEKWVWERGQGVFAENGVLLGLEGFITDITELKNAEKAIRESEEHHREISGIISDYAYSFIVEPDNTLKREWVLGNLQRITGFTPEEVESRGGWPSLVHPDDMPAALARARRLMAGRDDVIEFRILRKDGGIRWVRDYARPVWDESEGRVIRIYGSVQDVTERIRMEEEYRTLFREMLDGFALHEIICDGAGRPMDYRFLAVNPAFERMTGLKAEEIVGRTVLEVLPGTEPFWVEKYGEVATTGEPVLFESYGRELDKYYQVSAFSPEPDRFACVFIDITERRNSEKTLKDTLERLRRITRSVIEVIVRAVEARDPYTAGHQLRVGDLARAIASEMGLSSEEVEGIRIAGVIHDLGKISVPTEILSKPRKLSDMEFAIVKEHPQKGYEILREVDFEWPVADMVHQHHERLDGSGYPLGLKEGQVITGARILAVADVVEAMASHRPYRPNLGLDAALKEISQGRGVLYDQEAVDACIRLFREKRYELVAT